MKTKPIIDIKRLEWLITNGEASYSDGRHSFEYEMLLDLMKRLKVRVNKNATYERMQEIYTAKQAKRPKENLNNQTTYHFAWQIKISTTYWNDWNENKYVWPRKTAKEILDRMRRLRAKHIEDVANDECDYEKMELSFHFTPTPRKKIP